MRELDQLRTTSDRLRGSVGLDEKLQLIEGIGGQLKRTLRVLKTHESTSLVERLSLLLQTLLFLEQVI